MPLAEEYLRRQGYDVLGPRPPVQKLRRRKWARLEWPLFHRYLFAGAADEQFRWSLRSTVGVTSLVRFGSTVAEVASGLVERLHSAVEASWQASRIFKQGQSVTGD